MALLRTALLVLAGVSCVRATPQHPAAADPCLPGPLPRHGFVVCTWGLASTNAIVVDYGRRTLRFVREPFFFPDARVEIDRAVPIAQASVETLRVLAVAAQREEPHGEAPHITDVGETFYAIDGNQHVEIAGTMFDAKDGEPAWRPIAGRLVDESFELAKISGAFP